MLMKAAQYPSKDPAQWSEIYKKVYKSARGIPAGTNAAPDITKHLPAVL